VKQYLPYIIGALVITLVAVLILQGKAKQHVFDERVTFNRRDRIPYGCYVAYNNMTQLFPDAKKKLNSKAPLYWDSLSEYKENQALIIVSKNFLPDEYELGYLRRFAENGNTVFVSAANFSEYAMDEFRFAVPRMQEVFNNLSIKTEKDSVTLLIGRDSFGVSLMQPPFTDAHQYILPGKRFQSYFSLWNEATSTVLGYDEDNIPNFLKIHVGKGAFFIHLNPLAFTNYFILHKENNEYFSQVMSVIPEDTKTIVWDEYFQRKRTIYRPPEDDEKRKGALSGMMQHPAFRTAFWILLLFLFLFALQEMRRKQRYIPVVQKPRNDSLDFVKTIGRLYYEKRDHLNLSRKMAAYFLEHVRNQYKIPTGRLDERFVKMLHFKSGYDEGEIERIVNFIKDLDVAEVDSHKLATFHKQLEAFYKTS